MATQTQPQNPINQPYTYAQLQQLAEQQATAAIAGENAPLQAQVGTYGSQKTAAEKTIGAEFGALQPYVQQSANQVQAGAQQAESIAQQVFAAAGTRMNQLHQQEAQQLAQQMGGPVTSGTFTDALAPAEGVLPSEQGAGVLGSLSNALTDTVAAQKFAGQVFPAMRTEDVAKSDAYFNDQIKQLQDQIDKNAGAKSDLVNSKLNDLVQQERAFKQSIAQQHLERLKAQRDWKVQQASLHSQKIRDALATRAAKQAGVRIGQEQQRINIERQHVTRADRLAAQRMGLSVAEFKQRQYHENQTAKVGQAKLAEGLSKDITSLVQSSMGGGHPISTHVRSYVPGAYGNSAFQSHSGEYFDPHHGPKGKDGKPVGQWYKIAIESKPASGHVVHDPNRLFALARASYPQFGRKRTINLIRAQNPAWKNWKPGQKIAPPPPKPKKTPKNPPSVFGP